VLTGLHAVIGILAALNHRAETGQGQRVEVNLLSSMLSGLVNFGGAYALAGEVSHGMGIRHPGISPYEPFDTADRPLVVAAANDNLFGQLCGCLGLADLPTDERFATNRQRVLNRSELAQELGGVLKTESADVWFDRLTAAGVPCGPINDVAQGMELAETLGLEPIVDVAGSAQVANPIRLSKTPVSYRLPPPPMHGGEEEILRWLDDDGNDAT
ncbi:MAG: CoA transferase, partial [Nocardioidaceae bacterium]